MVRRVEGQRCQPGVRRDALDSCGTGERAGLGIQWTCRVNSERWHSAGVKAWTVSHPIGFEFWLLHFVAPTSVPQNL